MKFSQKLLLAVLIGAAVASTGALVFGTWTAETLVLNSAPTKLNRPAPSGYSNGFLVSNNGPNRIDCALGQAADGGPPLYPDGGQVVAIGKAQPVISGQPFSGPPGASVVQIWCIATSADQVTGAATVVTEAP